MPQTLKFKVRRQKPELIPPAKHTPRESKTLPDVDSQGILRVQSIFIPQIPKWVKSFLFMFVDCTAEGVMFIEADVRLECFGDILHPFPCDELLFYVPGFGSIFGCPILLIQVTRLLCWGFIFAIRLNHVMGVAIGIAGFMATIGEMALGADGPSAQPEWQRELLKARNPPRVTCRQPEFIDILSRYALHFLFSPNEISDLCWLIPHHLKGYSTFDLLFAFIWRSQTIAHQLDPHQKIHFTFTVDAHSRFNPPLPAGSYGNGFGLAASLLLFKSCAKTRWNFP